MEKEFTQAEKDELIESAKGVVPMDRFNEPEPKEEPEEPATPEPAEPEKAEESKEYKSVLAQKDHFRTKAEKAEAELEAIKAQIKEQRETEVNPQPAPVKQTSSNDPMEVVKISKLLSKFGDDETELIMDRAKGQSYEAIKKAAEDEWTQLAIQAKREKAEREKAIPTPSSHGSIPGFEDQDQGKLIKEGRHKEIWEAARRSEKGGDV